METLRKHWLLPLLVVLWLPDIYTLWPLPSDTAAVAASSLFRNLAQDFDKTKTVFSESEQKKIDRGLESLTNPDKQLAWLWQRWLILMVVVSLGITAIVYAARRGSYWKAGLLVASSCYLAFVTGFPISRAVRAEQWTMWWQMLSQYPDWGTAAVVYGVVMPFMHVVLIISLVVSTLLATLKKNNLTLHSRWTR